MTPTEYQHQNNLSDLQFCRLLNDNRPSIMDPPIYEWRLKRLKEGKRPTQLETYALMHATDNECERYKE